MEAPTPRPLGDLHAAGLSTFGLLLTGRLSLRNELLSALSVHTKTPFRTREEQRVSEVWEERYFVLTRKALHYYVRARGGQQQLGGGRDMFGKHEGSVAISSIASLQEDVPALELTLVTKGPGRNYVLRARTKGSFDRWGSTLSGATLNLFGSTDRVFSNSPSLTNIPSYQNFLSAPPAPLRSDNVAYAGLASHALGLTVLLERGLPWGVPLQLALGPPCRLDTSRDTLSVALEGGGSVTVPIASTLGRHRAGAAVFEVQPPIVIHSHVRMSWRPSAPPAANHAAPLSGLMSALLPPEHRHRWLLPWSGLLAALALAAAVVWAAMQQQAGVEVGRIPKWSRGAAVAEAVLGSRAWSAATALLSAPVGSPLPTMRGMTTLHPVRALLSSFASSSSGLALLLALLTNAMLRRFRASRGTQPPRAWAIEFSPATGADFNPPDVSGRQVRMLYVCVYVCTFSAAPAHAR